MICKFKNGVIFIVGESNTNGDVCDDCQYFYRKDVVAYALLYKKWQKLNRTDIP